MAGRGVDEGRRKPPGCGVRARKHGPGGQKSRRWSAVWRTCLARHVNAARRWTAGCAARRSIPSHWAGMKGRQASPGPRQRIRAMTLGCLTIESEKSGCRYTRRHGRTCSGHPRLLILQGRQDVDARDKRGHDSGKYRSRPSLSLGRDDRKKTVRQGPRSGIAYGAYSAHSGVLRIRGKLR